MELRGPGVREALPVAPAGTGTGPDRGGRGDGRPRGARWSARGRRAALKGYPLTGAGATRMAPRASRRRSGARVARAARGAALVLSVWAVWAAGAPAPARAEAQPREATAPRVVVCLGDSLTEGYGLAPEQSYPRVLERELRRRGLAVRVVNAGISGSTSASAVSRLRWQLRADPDVVVIALGANDGLRGVDLASTREHLARAIGLAKSHGVRVVLGGMQIPPNYGPEYTREFQDLFPALAEEHDVALVPFLLEGVAADPDKNLPDGIHPNAEGARIVADNVLEVLIPVLREVEEAPAS